MLLKFVYLAENMRPKFGFFILLFVTSHLFARTQMPMLIDFQTPISLLKVVTDATERKAGLSNATITFQNSHDDKSHILYVHLQPQPNGACFAGFKIQQPFDLSSFAKLIITLQNLSENKSYYQLVLNTEDSQEKGYDYQKPFTLTSNTTQRITFQLSTFKTTRRGEPYPDAPDIDLSKITSIGIRIIGRAQQNIYQTGLYGLRLLAINAC